MHAQTGTLAVNAYPFLSPPHQRMELTVLIEIAAQIVAPLWPLESVIAVNPLSGFEDLPFEQAIAEAGTLFGARGSLPLAQWRALMAEGRIDSMALRKAAVAALGGVDTAFALLGPDLNAYNLLLARLEEVPVDDAPPRRRQLSPGLAVLTRWLAAFFDRNIALPLYDRARGLYASVAECLRHDPALLRLANKPGAALIANAPEDPLELIAIAMRRATVAPDSRIDWLRGLLAALPGWAGHVRWRNEHGGRSVSAGAPATMTELIALIAMVRIATEEKGDRPSPNLGPPMEIALLSHFGLPANAAESWSAEAQTRLAKVAAMDETALGLVFQQAAEATYISALAPKLEQSSQQRPLNASSPQAQLVFCIDVRSEPLRRALEAQGAYETLGYAGFFGLPIAIDPACAAPERNQLPVLLSPEHVVPERAVPGREAEANAMLSRYAALDGARAMLDATKGGATGFATAEATGPLAAIAILARTLAPRLTDKVRRAVLGERSSVLTPRAFNDQHSLFSLEQKLAYAKGLFALTGLTGPIARLVALVGHGGCTTNNAFATSLDCGACGGHPGGPNARLMAALLNDPDVRQGLAVQGNALPEETWFIAAQHDTTQDIVTIFDRQLVPASHNSDLEELECALDRAGARARDERAKSLGCGPDDLLAGAAHWGEVRPEWGLSGNAAFIIAPRFMTRDIDLAGSAFLHSYDWRHDEDGRALTAIMTAPMIVGQWINNQYLFSTTDNEVYGAGDKTTQNVIGGFGVVQGSGGDLCIGLPRQSLFRDDGVPYHTPRRLSVIIAAPLQRVQDIVLGHDAVGRLVENGWINLVVIDPWKHTAHGWVRGDWVTRPT
jgi:uncharacterized protein